jgi:phosphotransferase system enzyme I (PtsI)
MRKLSGNPAATGIVMGPSYWLLEEAYKPDKRRIENTAIEIERLDQAREIGREQLRDILAKVTAEVGEEEAAIFGAHILILDDPDLNKLITNRLEDERINIEFIWFEAIEFYAEQMEVLDDDYFRGRAADVRDVGKRILRILLGIDDTSLDSLEEPVVILARDLKPSDTVRLDKSKALGFCTLEGGPTSHTVILAKALGIPAVVGVGNELLKVRQGAPVIVDGDRGEVIVDPDDLSIRVYHSRQQKAIEESKTEREAAKLPAITKDQHQVKVVANIGGVEDATTALSYGAEGIGLLRTEFLYLDRESAPNEDEQYSAYKAIFDAMESRPIVVRTLDVGGDKPLPYLELGHEANPFLGWRAIRVCLDKPEFFKIQLRALLRAGVDHDLRIMFPMIATIQELRRAKELLDEAREEVIVGGYSVAESVQVGIMVEIPSVVMLADKFAKEIDFFSIGTNDLTQYTMAADRVNQKVTYLADACHPAVLQQINRVIDAAHERGIWVGLCGELAGDPDAIPILLGLELDEFSMDPFSIPRAKQIIRKWSLSDARQLTEQVLELDSAKSVREKVRNAGTV